MIPRRKRPNMPLRQVAGMRARWPGMNHRIGRDHRTVIWEGHLQPTPESRQYRLRIEYGPFGPPKAFVVSPKLPKDAPHVYADGSLCLYWPVERRWNDRASIADTIMGWAALWLYYFEVWKVAGEWMGPESPHALRLTQKAPEPVGP